MERAPKKKSPAKRSTRKAADTATRNTPVARAAAKTRRTASTTKGLLKAEFSEEAVKAVFVSSSSADSARMGPQDQPSPGNVQASSGRTQRLP